MFRIGVVLAVSFWAATASAQQWAEKMFATQSHDFGSVPRAAKVEFPFVFTNLYAEDVHIASVHASCGCTQPRIVNDTVKANQQGEILAEFNTRAFTGQHGARVTVTIDRPQYAQVVLNVRGYIRTDVVLDPSEVNLGSVNQGQGGSKTIRIDHAGRDNWQITGVSSNLAYLDADVKEVARGGGRVSYELAVHLKQGAPAGFLKDQLQVTTNDARSTQFPVIVEGQIVAPLTVSPTALMLGTVQPGQTITKQVVVKGAKPFRITAVKCDNADFSFGNSDDAKILHLVPITFHASGEAGKIATKIRFITDLDDAATIDLKAVGRIGAPLAGK